MVKFNEAEDRRLEKVLMAEETRQKAEQKQERMMLNFFANMFGGNHQPADDNDDDDVSVSTRLSRSNSVIFP